MLAALTVAFGVYAGRGIAGGSDSYGYVSQADLWLEGNLHVPQTSVRRVPWPFAQWTFAPLGYRAAFDGDGIVPSYSPGLPLILAAAKAAAGQCAIRWVAPLSGGLLLIATYAMGRLLFSASIGAAAAWLVATSPVVLMMLLQPMSDLPVAACWALAVCGCLLDSRRGAFLAGLAAGMAIVIRPNLVHVGILIGLWIAARDLKRSPMDIWRTLLYALTPAAACVFIALLNRSLYGSPTTSGYGELQMLFMPGRVPANLMRYTLWLVEAQTPLALAAVLAVFVPQRIMKMDGVRGTGRTLLALVVGGVIACYLVYTTFDAWWYLRFLLPCWPAICLTAAWLLSWPSGRTFTTPAIVVLACVGCYGLWYAGKTGTFNSGESDRRYVIVARLVRDATPANSVIFSMQHSGSTRYYGGRMTLRYDVLSERWLDRSVAWLQREGIHPYFLLDEVEVPEFRRRFEGGNTLGSLKVAQVFEYREGSKTFLYDPLQGERAGEKPVIFNGGDFRIEPCPLPASPPQLDVKE